MKKLILLSICIAAILFTGCAKDYYTTLENGSNGKVGSLQVKISSAMQNVNVTIDNKIVANDKFTDNIIVNNIPVGEHKLLVAASGGNRHDLRKETDITINPGEQNTQIIKAPSRTTGSYLIQFGTFIGGLAFFLIAN